MAFAQQQQQQQQQQQLVQPAQDDNASLSSVSGANGACKVRVVNGKTLVLNAPTYKIKFTRVNYHRQRLVLKSNLPAIIECEEPIEPPKQSNLALAPCAELNTVASCIPMYTQNGPVAPPMPNTVQMYGQNAPVAPPMPNDVQMYGQNGPVAPPMPNDVQMYGQNGPVAPPMPNDVQMYGQNGPVAPPMPNDVQMYGQNGPQVSGEDQSRVDWLDDLEGGFMAGDAPSSCAEKSNESKPKLSMLGENVMQADKVKRESNEAEMLSDIMKLAREMREEGLKFVEEAEKDRRRLTPSFEELGSSEGSDVSDESSVPEKEEEPMQEEPKKEEPKTVEPKKEEPKKVSKKKWYNFWSKDEDDEVAIPPPPKPMKKERSLIDELEDAEGGVFSRDQASAKLEPQVESRFSVPEGIEPKVSEPRVKMEPEWKVSYDKSSSLRRQAKMPQPPPALERISLTLRSSCSKCL